MQEVDDPYKTDGAISKDGRSALIDFEIAGDDEQTEERVDPVLAAVAARRQARTPSCASSSSATRARTRRSRRRFEDDFKKAEVTSLPITLIILVVAFGALVAAGIPLLLAITAVAATIGLLGPISQIWPVEESITSVVLLIGLAVGVDYALFYLRREREERAAGRSEEAALQAAAATSGRAVLISGLTVMVGDGRACTSAARPPSSGFATGTILVVAVAVIGSLTVLPAVLSKLGDRVEKGRVPFIGKRKRAGGESRIWGAVIDRVMRRPLVSADRRGRPAGGAGDPGLQHAHRAARHRHAAARHRGDADLRPDAGGVPGRPAARRGGREGRRRDLAAGAGRDRRT